MRKRTRPQGRIRLSKAPKAPCEDFGYRLDLRPVAGIGFDVHVDYDGEGLEYVGTLSAPTDGSADYELLYARAHKLARSDKIREI